MMRGSRIATVVSNVPIASGPCGVPSSIAARLARASRSLTSAA